MFNAHIRGWINYYVNYYGRVYPSAHYPTLRLEETGDPAA